MIALFLTLLVAATGCEGDAMAQQRVPPNWGRSYPLTTLSGNEQELARVELDHSADFTVMLGNIAEMRNQITLATNRILVSNGGVSDEQTVINSVRGTVLHVAARSVVVRSMQDPRTLIIGANTLRYHAQLALGRPSLHSYAEDEMTLTGNASLQIPLRPWTHSVKIAAYPAASAADYAVRQLFVGTAGTALEANFRDLTDFADPQPLVPTANTLLVAGNVAAPQVFFIVEQFWFQ